MSESTDRTSTWLADWMTAHAIPLWGVAYLRAFSTPRDAAGNRYPRAISFALPMRPDIMAGIQAGPTQSYADEYARVNARINDLSIKLADDIRAMGNQATPLAASVRSDPVNIRGDFPHKTAATRAGLGWIGSNCQLITRPFGPWVRLGTVFTDLDLPGSTPLERSFCGRCTRCMDACPAGALKGGRWYPGLAREALLDARGCDQWKKTHYYQYHQGHNCGICAAVCPYGLKSLRKPPHQN